MTLAIVRDYYADRTQRLVERLVKRRRAPGEDTEAHVCIGGPADFEARKFKSITVNWRNEKPDVPPNEAEVYEAFWWDLQPVRIENPDDPAQHVNTVRIRQVRYRRPDGSEVQLDNRPIFLAIGGGS